MTKRDTYWRRLPEEQINRNHIRVRKRDVLRQREKVVGSEKKTRQYSGHRTEEIIATRPYKERT